MKLVVALLPAKSTQAPVTCAEAESGPAYDVGPVQDLMPENELPRKPTASGWLYQPLESGGRSGAPEIVGEDDSTFSGKLCVALAVPHQTSHETVVAASV